MPSDAVKPTNQSRIKELEEELSKTKYNKRTQHHVGLVKAKIAILKEKEQGRVSGKKKGEGYSVKRSGDGTAILVGFPSVGKSTLLNALTNANSEVGSYAFTTLTCIPGLLEHRHAKIQVLDVPGIIKGASSGSGRGREVLACAQSADLAILVVDVFYPEHLEIIKKELYDTSLRINQRKPIVKIEKRMKGGIDFGATVKLTKIDRKTVVDMLKEFRIVNAGVVVRDNITPEELIDAIEGNKKYIPAITVLNKIDMATPEQLAAAKKAVKPDVCISAQKGLNIDELKDVIFSKMGFIRVYCKEWGKKADMDVPLIMQQGDTMKDVCDKLHREFVDKFKYARVWGSSVKYDGQIVKKLTHTVKDKDVVEVHTS